MTKLPSSAMSLKQFMLRNEVLKLYREIMKTIKSVPDESNRADLREWARNDFKSNKSQSDEMAIKILMQHAKAALKELKTSLDLSK